MADETPPRRPASPEPASDAKKHANKLVVLSSVAKPPLNEEESLLGAPTDGTKGPPPLPSKTGEENLIRPVGWTTRPGGTTTIIKLPPKTGVLPRLTSLSQKSQVPSQTTSGVVEANKRSAPIQLKAPIAPTETPEQESIFGSPGSVPVEMKPPVVRKATPPPLPPPVSKKSEPSPATVAAMAKMPPLGVSAATLQPHHVTHVPPLVSHDSASPEADAEVAKLSGKPAIAKVVPADVPPKIDPLAQTARLAAPVINRVPAISTTSAPPATLPAQSLISLPVATQKPTQTDSLRAEYRSPENEAKKHRLPPRADTTSRLVKPPQASPTASIKLPERSSSESALKPAPVGIPPKVFPVGPPSSQIKLPAHATPAKPSSVASKAVKSSVTPPTIPLHPGKGTVKPPTIPIQPAPVHVFSSPIIAGKQATPPVESEDEEVVAAVAPSSRAVRMRKRRLIGIIVFYVLLVALVPCLYFVALHFTQETRVEGQVIPPQGMLLDKEVWIVTDFRDLAKGIADDLSTDRMSSLQDLQEKLGHLQRAQADVATREARIRTFKDQIQSDNQEEMSLVKQARAASQQVWDGPGASLEADYQSRLMALNQAITDRAKANRLNYNPDPNFFSPEVWANAYRLSLYEVPQGVDAVKERTWLDAQMKAWHDFTKAMDQKQNELREQATQLRLAPASRVADLKAQIEDLQQRIDGTIAEEEPLKAELEQAQADLSASQGKEAALDAPKFAELDALPSNNIIKRLPVASNGRFSWRELEKESTYGVGEKSHVFWIFARALRSDGRQYWAMHRFTVDKNSTTLMMLEPDGFLSTKAILRPDLSPDEQAQ